MPRVAKIVLVAVFGGVGLILGAVAIYLFLDARRFADAERAEGVVTHLVWRARGRRGGSVAYPVVRFETPGGVVEFQASVGTSPPSYQVGDRVTVLYRPEDPRDARIESFSGLYLGATILGAIAAIFAGVAGAVLLVTGARARRRARALQFGRPVRARVTGVRVDTRYRMNRRSPWVIDAEYRDEALGKTYAFTSEPLWTLPPALALGGGEVTVYYIPDEPEVYAFQLESPREPAA